MASRVRPDHPRCYKFVVISIYPKFHRNPFRVFGATGDPNLPFDITFVIGFYSSLYYRTSREDVLWLWKITFSSIVKRFFMAFHSSFPQFPAPTFSCLAFSVDPSSPLANAPWWRRWWRHSSWTTSSELHCRARQPSCSRHPPSLYFHSQRTTITRPAATTIAPTNSPSLLGVVGLHTHIPTIANWTHYASTSAYSTNSLRRRWYCKATAHCNVIP